jgi:protein involved in temperature-dependent protein secretion
MSPQESAFPGLANSGPFASYSDCDTHLAEVADLLAAGVMRLTAAKSSRMSADGADKPVDCEEIWSGAVATLDEEIRE